MTQRGNSIALAVALLLGLAVLVNAAYRMATGVPDAYAHQGVTLLLVAIYLVLFPSGTLLQRANHRRLGRWLAGFGWIAAAGYVILVFT